MTSVREGIVQELFASARRNYPRTKIIITEPWETISADLIDMKKYKSSNKNFVYILTVIDNFTKFAFAFPLKTKSAAEVAKNLKIVFENGHPIKKLFTDEGKEFKNSDLKKLMDEHGIKGYHVYSTVKASIVER